MKTVTMNDPNKIETAVDMNTIRERVQRIKASWTEKTAKDRAEEGKRRRAELERMLMGTPAALKTEKCDFTLVG